MAKKSELLMDMTCRDPLTGIFNWRYVEERLSDGWARRKGAREMLTIVLVKVGSLQNLSEPSGLVSNDMCLMAVADRLRNVAS